MRIRWEWVAAIALCIVLGSSLPLFAQAKPGEIGGQLFKEDARTPVPKAQIIVRHITTATRLQDITDSKGRFLIRKALPGSYEVEAVVAGQTYRYPATVKVVSERLTRLCLALDPEHMALRLLEETCEPKPIFWPRFRKYILIGGTLVAAGVIVYVATRPKKEVTPRRPGE